MPAIIDTNVLIVANGHESPQASPTCILVCVQYLRHVEQEDSIVLDSQWHILSEYKNKVSPTGQPGVGDAFLKWILKNLANPKRCTQVSITPHPERTFAEFPEDPDLAEFDLSDRKFVAVAIAHPDSPPIANAVDTDWLPVQAILHKYGITIKFLCPDLNAK